MDRRSLLGRAGALGAFGLAGCLGGSTGGRSPTDGEPEDTGDGTDAGTPAGTPSPSPTPTADGDGGGSGNGIPSTSVPDKPHPLDREGAVAYARSYERARTVERLAFDGATEVSVTCEAFLHRETPAGFVVLAGCGGSATDGGRYADLGGRPAFYYLADERTVRVADPRRTGADRTYAADAPDGNLDHPAGIRLYNFLPSARHLAVRVVHRGSGETAHDAEHELDAESGAVVEGLARRRGTYAVTVASGEASATAEWTVGEGTGGRATLTGTLAPGPDAGIGTARIDEIEQLGPV